jgi:hypothetical protein
VRTDRLAYSSITTQLHKPPDPPTLNPKSGAPVTPCHTSATRYTQFKSLRVWRVVGGEVVERFSFHHLPTIPVIAGSGSLLGWM